MVELAGDKQGRWPEVASRATWAISSALEGEFEAKTRDGKVEVRPVFEVLREKLNREYTPEQATGVTGVLPTVIRQLAREFGCMKTRWFRTGRLLEGSGMKTGKDKVTCQKGTFGKRRMGWAPF